MSDIRTALDAALDRVAWTPAEPPQERGGLPYATHEGELHLPGLPPLRVYRLNTGDRVFEAEGVRRLFEAIG